MKITIRRVLILSLTIGISIHLPCYADTTSAEAAEHAKERTVLENHDATPNMRNTAIEQLTSLITKNPNLAEAYCYRGEIYQNLRKPNESFQVFNRAIEADPKFGCPLHGRCLWYTGSRKAMTRR